MLDNSQRYESSLCQNCNIIQMLKEKQCVKCAENRDHVHHLEKYDCCLCGQSKPFSSFYKPVLCGSCLQLNIGANIAKNGGDITTLGDGNNKSIVIHTNQQVIPIILPNVKIVDKSIEFTPSVYLYPEIYAQHNILKNEYEKLKKINQQLIDANVILTEQNKQLHYELYCHEYRNKEKMNIVSQYMSI